MPGVHVVAGEPVPTIRRLAFTTLGANLAIAGIGFAASVVIGRVLGPEGRGNVVAFQMIPSIAALVAAVGLPHAATYFAAVKPGSASTTVRRSAVLAVIAGVIGASVAALCSWFYLGGDHPPAVRTAGLVFSTSVVLLPVLGVIIHPLRSVNRTGVWNLLRIFLDSSLVGAAILALFAGASYVAIALVQVAWLAMLTPVAGLKWHHRGSDQSADHPVTYRQILGYGVPTMFATLPYFLNFRVDQLILLSLRDSRELGLYATAVTWSAASLPITNTLAHLTLSRLAGKTEDRDASAARFVRLSVALACGVALLLSVAAPVAILLLFGKAFSGAIRLAVVLCFATAVLGVTTTTEEALRAYGDVRYPARAQIGGLALNVAMLFAFIPSMGPWGAVLASGLAYSGVCVAVLLRVRKIASLRGRALLPTLDDARLLLALCRRPAPRIDPSSNSEDRDAQ